MPASGIAPRILGVGLPVRDLTFRVEASIRLGPATSSMAPSRFGLRRTVAPEALLFAAAAAAMKCSRRGGGPAAH